MARSKVRTIKKGFACCGVAISGRPAPRSLVSSVCPLPRLQVELDGTTTSRGEEVLKLNAERNNGRAAMMGITGMIVHNALGVDSLFPIVS